MSLVKMKKIQLIGMKKERLKILKFLQEHELIELTQWEIDLPKADHENEELDFHHKLSDLEFALKVLKPYERKRKFKEGPLTHSYEGIEQIGKTYNFTPIVKKCKEIEESSTLAKNKIQSLEQEIENLKPWTSVGFPTDQRETENTRLVFAIAKSEDFKNLELDTVKCKEAGQDVYFYTIFHKAKVDAVRESFSKFNVTNIEVPETEKSPKEQIKEYEAEIKSLQEKIEKNEEQLKELAKESENLKVAHQHYFWNTESIEAINHTYETEQTFLLTGWTPEHTLGDLQKALSKEFPATAIQELEPAKDERPPVALKNGKFMKPFQSVTMVYGLPLPNELDPTAVLSAFFIIFFGMALSDAGYGLMIFATMFLTLKFIKIPKKSQGMIKLLLLAGIVTFLVGTIYGGWLGLTVEQVPDFMTTLGADGEEKFVFQFLNPVKSPITILILTFALGYIQTLVGLMVKVVHEFKQGNKKGAILDTGLWFSALFFIGLLITSVTGILPEASKPIWTWLIYANLIALVLTQGRKNNSIVSKFFGGLLSLYDFVGYLGDVLSYSRLLALGLATGIIAMAVNIVAGLLTEMIPYIGWILAAIVFVGGHVFNLAINALGAFIHAGRLQFVEFFGKFMEGGGAGFNPLKRTDVYVIPEEKF